MKIKNETENITSLPRPSMWGFLPTIDFERLYSPTPGVIRTSVKSYFFPNPKLVPLLDNMDIES